MSGGRKLNFSAPLVMGILNVTPDSFFDGGKYNSPEQAVTLAEKLLREGAAILDLGAVSTRPGSKPPSEAEEWGRLEPVLAAVRRKFPDAVLSVDTFRAGIAQKAVAAGADIINDISGGTMDKNMFATIAALDVPYVLMHIRGTPENMQDAPHYVDVVLAVKNYFIEKISALKKLRFNKIIPDPGFGFGKTLEHNYKLLHALPEFVKLGFPVMVGLSRKSMVTKLLGIGKNEALPATVALNTIALLKGAKIIRVHDVKEAIECVRIINYLGHVC